MLLQNPKTENFENSLNQDDFTIVQKMLEEVLNTRVQECVGMYSKGIKMVNIEEIGALSVEGEKRSNALANIQVITAVWEERL